MAEGGLEMRGVLPLVLPGADKIRKQTIRWTSSGLEGTMSIRYATVDSAWLKAAASMLVIRWIRPLCLPLIIAMQLQTPNVSTAILIEMAVNDLSCLFIRDGHQ